MLSIMALDTLWEEDINISRLLNNAYMRRQLPIKRLTVFNELSSLLENPMEDIKQYNVIFVSFSDRINDYVEFAQTLRKQQDNIFIVFVVDKKVNISLCVRPSVRLSGILFIPLEEQDIYKTIREIYVEYLRIEEQEEQSIFTVKIGGEYFSINTGEISFFEAQGKKIAVKTRGQEILFYSSFGTILEQLPHWFVRCHKGFVINTKQIIQTSFTEMRLMLKDESIIPISRTYKDEIRTMLEARDT